MPGSLDTTNTILAIIAAVSVLQGLVLIGLGVAGWKLYRRATATIREIDEKRVQPLAAKVDSILDQARRLTDRVQHRAERVEAAIDDTVERVNHAATGVRSTVADTVNRVSHAVTGLRTALVNALTTDGQGAEPSRHHSRFARETSASAGSPRPVSTSGGESQHTAVPDVREGGF